jgi:uncharacterized membrane protein
MPAVLHSFEAKIQKNRKFTEKVADTINRLCGSFGFFVLNVVIFFSWLVINTGLVPHLPIIDPFPFSFLTMAVSLEAIFLSIFVLISQNRQSTIDSIREEIHLQINEIAEKEITKILKLVSELHQAKFKSRLPDPELDRMLQTTDASKIAKAVEKELEPEPLLISELIEKLEDKLPLYRRKK